MDPDSKDRYGRSPLLYAANDEHEAVVRLLLKRGADPDLKDDLHKSPRSYATLSKHETIVRLFQGQDEEADSNRYLEGSMQI